MKTLGWLGTACLLMGIVVPCTAVAQIEGDGPKPADSAAGANEAKDKVANYMTEGARAAAAGEWDDAYAEYTIAWAELQTWEIAAALGEAAYMTKHYAEAVQRLRYYLREVPPERISADDRKKVEGRITEARSRTGEILIVGSTGADVTVDDVDAGKTPLAEPILVDPGKHKVEVRQGSRGESKTTEVAIGAKVTLDFTPPKAAPSKTVFVKEKGVLTPQIRTAAIISGGALALGGFIAGGASLGVSFAKADDKKTARLDPFGESAAKTAAQAEADAQNVAIWCFVGGGAAVAGTTLFYLFTRPRAPSPVKAGVFVGPQGPSVWLLGRF